TRAELRRFRWKAVAGSPTEPELSAAPGWSEPITSPRFNWVPTTRGLHTLAVQFMDRDLNRSPLGLATVNVAPLWYANAWIMAPGGGAVLGLVGWAFVARSLVVRRKREAEQLREQMLEQEREARKKLQDSEALYSSLVDNLDQWLIRKDLKGRYIFVNEAFCQFYGTTADKLIGKTVFEVMPREFAEKVHAADQSVIESGQTVSSEDL